MTHPCRSFVSNAVVLVVLVACGCDRDAKKDAPPPPAASPAAATPAAPATTAAAAATTAAPAATTAAPAPSGDHSKHPHPGGSAR